MNGNDNDYDDYDLGLTIGKSQHPQLVSLYVDALQQSSTELSASREIVRKSHTARIT